MSKRRGLFQTLLDGYKDSDFHFKDRCVILVALGFEERIKGDHHIFTKDGVVEIINIQPKRDKAKPYQV